MAEVLNVSKREEKGKRNAKRLRLGGAIPGNLYGHGEANVSLSVKADELKAAIRHGARVVDLQGAVSEKAFIKELQWDTFGNDVLHIDLSRVSADERLQVKVTVELRGQAVGVKEGGVIEHVVHDVDIECLAIEIPEKLFLRVNDLKIGDSLMASSIELPAGAKLMSDPEELIVHCVLPAVEEEAGEAVAEGAEPEVIGRKAEDEEEEAE